MNDLSTSTPESSPETPEAAKAVDTPDFKVVKTSTTSSLSGRCQLQYQIGLDDSSLLHIRLQSSTGHGVFNKDWFAFADIEGALAKLPRKAPIVSKSLQQITAGKSTVTAGFLIAALVNEGMLKLVQQQAEEGAEGDSTTPKAQYQLGDPDAFKSAMAELLTSTEARDASKTLKLTGKSKKVS